MTANKTGCRYLWFGLCFILITASVLFLAVFGNLDNNEGWYGNDTYLVMSGKSIYQDFFYHRLPLFIQTYALAAKITGAGLLKLRMISVAFTLLLVLGTYLFLRRITDRKIALIGMLFFLSSFDILRYYTTIQSYSLVALLLLVSVYISLLKSNPFYRYSLIGILLAFVQWTRYPIDYIPLAFFIYLFVLYLRNPKVIYVSIGCFVATHVLLLAVYYSPEFRFDVEYGMFQEAPMTFKTLLQFKSQWISFSIISYLAVILIGGLLAIHFAAKRPGIRTITQTILERDWLFLTLLLIAGNAGMYFMAEAGHPVQMAYVLPLMIIMVAYMLFKFLQSHKGINRSVFYAGLLFVLIIGAFVNDRNFNLSRRHAHLFVMNNIGREISNVTSEEDRLLVFGPVMGISSSRSLVSGLEFDLFGYTDGSISGEEVKRYHLMNDQELMRIVKNKQAQMVIINERFLYSKAMGRKLENVREEILGILDNEYERIHINDSFYKDVFGVIKIYRQPVFSYLPKNER